LYCVGSTRTGKVSQYSVSWLPIGGR
jgi:hypothetical protein